MSYELLLQPNGWSCLPTAFAMILQITPKNICDFLQHDGSEILWPDLPEPLCRRSFHIQEMIDISIYLGMFPIPIEPLPCMCPDDGEVLEIGRVVSIEQYLTDRPGVLVGEYNNRRHAVAWDREKVLDPTGYTYPLEDFGIETFYAFF